MSERLTKIIIRTKRKTLALEIRPDSSLIVRAPLGTPLRVIDDFISQKNEWVIRTRKIAREKYAHPTDKRFITDEKFLYLGAAYGLSVVSRSYAPVVFDGTRFLLWDVYRPVARNRFIAWYKDRALDIIRKRAEEHSSRVALRFSSIRITGTRRCLGSCSRAGRLNFSWRLIMAPEHVIDYVIIHELAHLEIRDHSRKFWEKVGSLMPDYRTGKTWLKANYNLLEL